MPLLSVSDALLFFTLILNGIAISKPRGGLLEPTDSPSPSAGNSSSSTDDAATDLLSPSEEKSQERDSGLSERFGQLLLAFRRCGVFIAIWNVALMVAMLTILS